MTAGASVLMVADVFLIVCVVWLFFTMRESARLREKSGYHQGYREGLRQHIPRLERDFQKVFERGRKCGMEEAAKLHAMPKSHAGARRVRDLLFKYHPDRHAGAPLAEEITKDLTQLRTELRL